MAVDLIPRNRNMPNLRMWTPATPGMLGENIVRASASSPSRRGQRPSLAAYLEGVRDGVLGGHYCLERLGIQRTRLGPVPIAPSVVFQKFASHRECRGAPQKPLIKVTSTAPPTKFVPYLVVASEGEMYRMVSTLSLSIRRSSPSSPRCAPLTTTNA